MFRGVEQARLRVVEASWRDSVTRDNAIRSRKRTTNEATFGEEGDTSQNCCGDANRPVGALGGGGKRLMKIRIRIRIRTRNAKSNKHNRALYA